VHYQIADDVAEFDHVSILIFHLIKKLNTAPQDSSSSAVDVCGQGQSCVEETWVHHCKR
jgi:hypothetical protein